MFLGIISALAWVHGEEPGNTLVRIVDQPTNIYIHIYDTWAVSMKRTGKHVVTGRVIPGNQLITELGFHGYGN
jgi:hypothetical protein